MLYAPPIRDYRSFYIQYDGQTIKDILEDYSIVVKTHDYPMALKPKEPYKNQWKDEHGDEEYIGSNGLYFEAFTFKMECALFASGSTAIADLNGGIRSFRTFLSHGLFKTYDAYTGFGFQNVRLAEFPMPSEDSYQLWEVGANGSKTTYTRVIFTVTLKVNDPVTHLELVDNNIVVV